MGCNTSTVSMATSGKFLHELNISADKATFALGCFWAPDSLFGVTKGVIRTKVGYTGGTKDMPIYHKLGDHTEAIQIDYNPEEIKYDQLLDIFWKSHDPTSRSSKQYSSFIYYHNQEQKILAEKSLEEAQKVQSKPILTGVVPASAFYDAENYHQKYRLQQYKDIVASLGLETKDDFINSHIAARLNGYVVGFGTIKQFDEEAEKLGLTGVLKDKIRNLVIKNEGRGLFC